MFLSDEMIRKEYVEGTGEYFRRLAVRLSSAPTDSKKERHQVWVVSTFYCTMRFLNNQRYLPADAGSTVIWTLRPRETELKLRAAAVRSREDCEAQHALKTVKLKLIRVGKELFAEYGRKYSFE